MWDDLMDRLTQAIKWLLVLAMMTVTLMLTLTGVYAMFLVCKWVIQLVRHALGV